MSERCKNCGEIKYLMCFCKEVDPSSRSPACSVSDLERDAMRYRWLRERNLETIHHGGVFAGVTPDNLVLNGIDLDEAIDSAIAHRDGGNMADITKLPPGIERRKCPGCGFREAHIHVDMARFDFPCPRCGKHTLAEFVPDTDPEPPKPGKRRAA